MLDKGERPRLHQISVAAPGFLVTDPISEGKPKIVLPFQLVAEEEATPSQPTIKEEEGVVEVFDSEDDFKVFNHPLSPEAPTGDFGHLLPAQASHSQDDPSTLETIGIQCKTKQGLRDLMESQVGGDAPKKATQTKLPPLNPHNLSTLTLLTTRGKETRRAIKWQNEGRAPYPRRPRPKRELSRLG